MIESPGLAVLDKDDLGMRSASQALIGPSPVKKYVASHGRSKIVSIRLHLGRKHDFLEIHSLSGRCVSRA
ncbi:hypothetical protein [Amycolatopsis decaplanina]|uniref:hypothetical protein n=1 Tax=Amycolatopsis decaplanina TaxID=208441 RepID=UPI001427A9B9|nr:hypothetical protein [Amycolatopsis decaplanina]